MFKKIEIWILYLVVLLGILFTIGFGFLVRQELVGSVKVGGIGKFALTVAEIPRTAAKIFLNDNRMKDRFPELKGFTGDPNKDESYLLLSTINGDLGEGIVQLVDLTNFRVLHTWNPDIDAFNNLVNEDDFQYIRRDNNNARSRLAHPKLTSDGGLLFRGEGGSSLRKIDSCSELIFQQTKDLFHHSIETDIDKNIWIPSHIHPQSLPKKMVGRDYVENNGYRDDAIVKMSPNGEILYEKSVSEIFIDNDLNYLLFSIGGKYFKNDPIHLNDIQPVNFDGKFWKKGDVFLSLRNQSMVLLYRPSTNKIIWKGLGRYNYQHDVDILDDSRIVVFNNNVKDFYTGRTVDGNSEVIIYDFETDEYSYYLAGSMKENEVRTTTQGRSEILLNGDLLVEETNFGRTLYFNSDGTLRWTHLNRAKNGGVYSIGWSRILYDAADIKTVNEFLDSKDSCK